MDKTHRQQKYKSPLVPLHPKSSLFIFGVSFTNPVNHLMLYKQHLYALYLLLYGYGQEQHRNVLIQKIQKVSRALEKYLLHKGQVSYLHLNQQDAQANIAALHLLKQDLQQPRPYHSQIKFHSLKIRQSLRTGLKKIYQDRGQLRPYMNLFDFAKLAGSIFSLKCSIKQYYNFQLIQYNCQLFQDKNIEVFIQIDKSANTYRYIKQYHDSRLDAVCGSGIEDLNINNVPNNISDSSFMNLIQKDIQESQSQVQNQGRKRKNQQDGIQQQESQQQEEIAQGSDIAEQVQVQIDSDEPLVPQDYQFKRKVQYKQQSQSQEDVQVRVIKQQNKLKEQKNQKVEVQLRLQKSKVEQEQYKAKVSNNYSNNKTSATMKKSNKSIKSQKQQSKQQNSRIKSQNSIKLSQKQLKQKQKDRKQFMQDNIIKAHHKKQYKQQQYHKHQQSRHKYKKIHSLYQIQNFRTNIQQQQLTIRTQSQIISTTTNPIIYRQQKYENKKYQSHEPININNFAIKQNNNKVKQQQQYSKSIKKQTKTFKLQRTDSRQYQQQQQQQQMVMDSETQQININKMQQQQQQQHQQQKQNKQQIKNINTNIISQIKYDFFKKQLSSDLLDKINCQDLVQQLSNIDQFYEICGRKQISSIFKLGCDINQQQNQIQNKKPKKDINYIINTLQQAIRDGKQQQVQLYLKKSQQIIQKYKLRRQQTQYLLTYLSGQSPVKPVSPLPQNTKTVTTALPICVAALVQSSPPMSPMNMQERIIPVGVNVEALSQSLPNSYNNDLGNKLSVFNKSINQDSGNSFKLTTSILNNTISNSILNPKQSNNNISVINNKSNINNTNSQYNPTVNTSTDININPSASITKTSQSFNSNSNSNSNINNNPLKQKQLLILNKNNSVDLSYKAVMKLSNKTSSTLTQSISQSKSKSNSNTKSDYKSPQKNDKSEIKNRVHNLLERRYIPAVQPSAFSTEMHTQYPAKQKYSTQIINTANTNNNNIINEKSYQNSSNNNNNNNINYIPAVNKNEMNINVGNIINNTIQNNNQNNTNINNKIITNINNQIPLKYSPSPLATSYLPSSQTSIKSDNTTTNIIRINPLIKKNNASSSSSSSIKTYKYSSQVKITYENQLQNYQYITSINNNNASKLSIK